MHVRIRKMLAKYRARLARGLPCSGTEQGAPPSPCPSTAADEGDQAPLSPETVTHWQEHFP
jgi:hypothetical protein